MRFPPFKKNTNECFLTLDIGTEAVKAAVVTSNNQTYRIIGSAFRYFDELGIFERNKVILSAKDEAVKQAGITPKELLFGLSPDILRSRVRTAAVVRKKPAEITSRNEAKIIIESAFRKAEKEIVQYFARQSGILPGDIRFVSRKIIEIKIDGYEVPDVFGYNGENVEFKVLAGFLPKDYAERFSSFFMEAGFAPHIKNAVENFSALGITDGILLDIGGVTQASLIRNGKIEFIDDFELGGDDFSRTISQTLGMRPSDARLLKERYSNRDLSEQSRQRIKDILNSSVRSWHSALESRLKTIKGLLPDSVFLYGGASQLPEIEEILSDKKEVKFIRPADFKNVADDSKCASSPQFINLILLING